MLKKEEKEINELFGIVVTSETKSSKFTLVAALGMFEAVFVAVLFFLFYFGIGTDSDIIVTFVAPVGFKIYLTASHFFLCFGDAISSYWLFL